MSWMTCPGCGARDALVPAFAQASRCPGCAAGVWADLEGPFWPNRFAGADVPGSVRRHGTPGTILFAASASVRYYRGHTQMPAHVWTGSAVGLLADVTGQLSLAASGSSQHVPIVSSPDPSFAQAVTENVTPETFIFDVRGIRDRNYDVAIGTGPVPDERSAAATDALTRACRLHGLRVAVDEHFGALPPWALTSYASLNLGCSALQVQLAASLRTPQTNPTASYIVFAIMRAAAAAVV